VSRRGTVAVTAAGVAAVLVGAVFALTAAASPSGDDASPGAGDEPTGGSGSAPARATAEVAVRDLVLLDELDGDLSFGDARDVAAGRDGVVTEVPEVGTTVRAGDVLLAVATEPTVLLRGDVPAYRALEAGDEGDDVAQLERALVGLGLGDDLTVDDEFTEATADALQDWEEELGRDDPDGVLELGDVVFVPTDLRVDEVVAGPGSSVATGSTVLTVTATDRVVDLAVGPAVADRLEAGAPAVLVLPDGGEAPATVTSVAARPDTDPSTGEETVAVVVAPDDPAAVAAWDSGSVEVRVERSRTEDATAVPVEALLALAEGGYAVEVVAGDGTTSLVGVDAGTVADGWVELRGDAVADGTLAEGTTVVVAS
jgi:membrane fusion protein, multidrug efflux system